MLQQMRSAAKWIWIFIIISFVGGFLFVETSGLLGRDQLTTSSTVATVNGTDIPYLTWANLTNTLAQQREQTSGQGLNLDERRQVEDEAFDQLVNDILLQEELKRRGIRVTDQEIIEAAQLNPPPGLMQDPSLQTDGRFDIEKYQRLLKSPQARQQGLLIQLENYYRSEIPRAKLFDQLAGDVYISDAKLWSIYKDSHDSAQVSFVAFDAAGVPDSAVSVSDEELRRYYDANRDRFERPGRAVLSVLSIPRTVTAADTAATRARLMALREEIMKGAKFEDVARRESADQSSGPNGGSLGMSAPGRFVEEFEKAARALRPGEVSQPVLSSFGYHLITVDSRKGDSIDVRHILLNVQQSDSSATRTDRLADTLARIGASATRPEPFDSAAKVLNLRPEVVRAVEGQPVVTTNGVAPGASAWAFSGPRPGETSELLDSENAYFLVRLDSLTEGGVAPLAEVREDIRAVLLRRKKAASLEARAAEFAREAAASGLEAAAKARDASVEQSPMFARPMFVPGMGRLNAAIGAAFALPVGAISQPIVTDDGVFVIRVDKRVEASREAFEQQKAVQRQQALNALRQARVQNFLQGLRERADIEDRRKEINAAARRQAAAPA